MTDLEFTTKVRDVLMRHYVPTEKLPDGKPNPDYNPPARLEALSAVACAISMARIFKLIESGDSTMMLPVIIDLSFGLQENRFWKLHSATIVPIYKHCLSAKLLTMVNKQNGVQNVESESLGETWKHLFISIYDCLYGIMKTTENSALIMQEISRVL